ncbi:MAG: helix-turn-helix domain-containing protein [Eubacterium coprostanoligenes]|nr:helix-turn-helix domain-containing protein [Eubacterium coprostanoligenes]
MKATNDFNSEMGKRIIRRRKQLGLSQEQLAEIADVSPQMISTAERGSKSILSENLYKISKALDVSADYLLSGEITETNLENMYKRILKTPPDMQEKIHQILDILLEDEK